MKKKKIVKTEDELDAEDFDKSYAEYLKDKKTYTIKEVKETLDIDD